MNSCQEEPEQPGELQLAGYTSDYPEITFIASGALDYNGEMKYSQIVKVNMGKLPSTITVFPNPLVKMDCYMFP